MSEVINISYTIDKTIDEGTLTFQLSEIEEVKKVIVYLKEEDDIEIGQYEEEFPEEFVVYFNIFEDEKKEFIIKVIYQDETESEFYYTVSYNDEELEEDPIEEEPTPPEAPKNLMPIVNDDVMGVSLSWEYEELSSELVFKLYLNDEFTGVLSYDTHLELQDMIAKKPYRAKITALNTKTLQESDFSNEVYFEIEGLTGSNDPNNWVGVRLDNLTVIYNK